MAAIVKTRLVLAAMCCGAFLLAACGGGGGGSTLAAMPEATPSQPQPQQPQPQQPQSSQPEQRPERAQPSPTQGPSVGPDEIRTRFYALLDASNTMVERGTATPTQAVATGTALRDLASRIPRAPNLLYKSGIEIDDRRVHNLHGIALAHGFTTFVDTSYDGSPRRRIIDHMYVGLMEYGLFYLYTLTKRDPTSTPIAPRVIELDNPQDGWIDVGGNMTYLANTQQSSYNDKRFVGIWRGAMLGVRDTGGCSHPSYSGIPSGTCPLEDALSLGAGNLLTGEVVITGTGGRSVDIVMKNIRDTVTGASHNVPAWEDVTIGNDGSFLDFYDGPDMTLGHEIKGTFAGPEAEEVGGVFFYSHGILVSAMFGAFGAKLQQDE